jgi:Na+-transporting NADH:ubiquinone oxidoreductase subunit C
MNKRVSLVLFTILVTVVFIAPISFAYLLTKPIVALNEEVYLKRAVLSAAGVELPATNAEVKGVFDRRMEVRPSEARGGPVYRLKDEAGATAGWVLTRTGPGLWGDITMVIGFTADRERLSGIEFLKQSETPGLGARISEAWFKRQFSGKRGPFATVGEGEPSKENEFDAITGATFTSNAVRDIVNAAVGEAGGLPKEGVQ